MSGLMEISQNNTANTMDINISKQIQIQIEEYVDKTDIELFVIFNDMVRIIGLL